MVTALGIADVRVALDGSPAEIEEPQKTVRYAAVSWKDGTFQYDVAFDSPIGATSGSEVIRRMFRMTADGLLVTVVVDPPAGKESIGLYRHAEDIAMPTPAGRDW